MRVEAHFTRARPSSGLRPRCARLKLVDRLIFHYSFLIAEVGLALAALVTLGLFLRSLYGLQNTAAGFDHRNVTVCRFFLATNNYTPSEEQQFSRQLRERLLESPGVTGAAYSDSITLGFGLGKWNDVIVEGYAARRGENLGVHHASVSPGYFDVLRMPLLAGRDFKPEDNENAPWVIIVNETLAQRSFDGRVPVGRRVQIYGLLCAHRPRCERFPPGTPARDVGHRSELGRPDGHGPFGSFVFTLYRTPERWSSYGRGCQGVFANSIGVGRRSSRRGRKRSVLADEREDGTIKEVRRFPPHRVPGIRNRDELHAFDALGNAVH